VFPTGGTYPWSFVTQIFHNGQLSHGGEPKIFEVMKTVFTRFYMRADFLLRYGKYLHDH